METKDPTDTTDMIPNAAMVFVPGPKSSAFKNDAPAPPLRDGGRGAKGAREGGKESGNPIELVKFLKSLPPIKPTMRFGNSADF
jgi:hypothetical protein